MPTLPILDMLLADKTAAINALLAAGCVVEPKLQTTVEHPMIGTIHRAFGVVRNLAAEVDDATETVKVSTRRNEVVISDTQDNVEAGRRLADRFLLGLESPDNDRVTERLLDGRIKYMPANKTLAGLVRKTIGLRGPHLPWSFKPLNLELAMEVERACGTYGFVVFYSEATSFDQESPPGLKVGRIFTTPFGVEGFGTWQEPISSDILDEDVGMLLEVNWLGAP